MRKASLNNDGKQTVRHCLRFQEVLLMESILQAIGNLGFPIAVSVYLLVRIEAKLENLAASIAGLAQAVNGLRK